ncbi:Myb/SANT-like DNA-binding domain-containing protein [Camponotus japonicus]
MSHKKIWALIAAEMVKHGHNVTGPQCLSKFSGLKRTYKSIKDNNKQSGAGTKTWPYFSHMDNLLHSKPYMSPLTTVSSIGKITEAENSSLSSVESSENEKPVYSKKPRLMSSVEQLIDDLRTDRNTAEEAMERRHKENIDLRQQFLHSFEKMIEFLSKK